MFRDGDLPPYILINFNKNISDGTAFGRRDGRSCHRLQLGICREGIVGTERSVSQFLPARAVVSQPGTCISG